MSSSSRRGFLSNRAFSSSTVSGQCGQIRSFLPSAAVLAVLYNTVRAFKRRWTLCSRQRFTVGNDLKEAVQRRQSPVPRSDRGLANLFDVSQKRENLERQRAMQSESSGM